MGNRETSKVFVYRGTVYYFVTPAYLERVERELYDALVCDYYFGGGHAKA